VFLLFYSTNPFILRRTIGVSIKGDINVISFRHSWPYERVMKDIYLNECPYCHSHNVLTSLDEDDMENAFEGIKTALVMPCCHNRMTIVKADEDYLWADELLRKEA
jgi:hypothetical protein